MHARHFAAPFLLLLANACASSDSAPDPAELAPAKKRLTLEQTAGRGESVDFRGSAPRYRWADDGVHLALGRDDDEVWLDPTTFAEVDVVKDEETLSGDDWNCYRMLEGIDETRAKAIAKAKAQVATNGGELRKQGGDLWYVQNGLARRLTNVESDGEEGEIELEELSPDGARVAYVRGNDLFVTTTGTAETRVVTTDGGTNVFNGKLDWVYQEEIYGRGDFKAFWWSPDSKHVAFLRLDESAVHDFTVIDHIDESSFRVKPEITKYPKVGDPNPTVELKVATIGVPDVRTIDLGDEPELLVVRVAWSPMGDRLVYMTQDRIQTWLDLCFADPATGTTSTLFRETSEVWTPRAEEPRWLDDGTFLWESARTGQTHVYHYSQAGELLATVTSGPWSVTRVVDVDAESGRIWFTGTKDGAVNSNLYRCALDGSGLVRLTSGDGRHTTSFNADRSLFLDSFSSLATPTRVRLCDGDGEVVRELGSAAPKDWDEYATSTWELLEIEARDGFPLDVALLKPVDFDPTKTYPVWLPTYSGPNAPSVRNSWNSSSWYQFLAQNGVIVFQVNVRSASGKGLESTGACYRQCGIPELRDLEDAVAWLTANPWADAERVGITGASYGGFMSAFALTHSTSFALAIAASGVYDWRLYDTIYTERYMQTPALNPEGYAATSVIGAAANLHGHLILTHGLMDDNVHFQNMAQLVFALQKADKDFEVMIYPQSRHGIREEALRFQNRRIEWRAIREHLLN